jgi:hypothetical protein
VAGSGTVVRGGGAWDYSVRIRRPRRAGTPSTPYRGVSAWALPDALMSDIRVLRSRPLKTA